MPQESADAPFGPVAAETTLKSDSQISDCRVTLGALFVGCAGWSYPHWRNSFYPRNVRPEHELQYYQQRFNACEINFTYHQMPSIERCEKWRKSSPPGFLLSLKAPKTLTHISPLCTDNHPQWSHFINASKALQDRLGPILIQLPPSFPVDLARLRALQPLLSKGCGIRAAFEFRHSSWFCDDVYDLMRQCNWALVKHAVPSAGISEQWNTSTSDWVYVRLHGKKDEHVWDYSSEELQPYVERIAELRAQGYACFVYFLNDADARAPANATSFFRTSRKAANEPFEGLLGVALDGAGVLKDMFGKQQQLQQHQDALSSQHTRQSLPCSSSSPILPPCDAIDLPSKTAHVSVCASSPSKAAAAANHSECGIMRFFSRRPPTAVSGPPPQKSRKIEDGYHAAAAFNRDQNASSSASNQVQAAPRELSDVIVLD
jgi:uncharacterized protein YecE (DUF72 family)